MEPSRGTQRVSALGVGRRDGDSCTPQLGLVLGAMITVLGLNIQQPARAQPSVVEDVEPQDIVERSAPPAPPGDDAVREGDPAPARSSDETSLAEAERLLETGDRDAARLELSKVRRARLPAGPARRRYAALRRALSRPVAHESEAPADATSANGSSRRTRAARLSRPPALKDDEFLACSGVCFLFGLSAVSSLYGWWRRRNWRCTICRNISSSRAVKHHWTLNGRRELLCSHCNQRARSDSSRRAMRGS